MTVLILMIIAGPVGDYVGLDYHFFVHSQGFDSMYTLIGDSGDVNIIDTNLVLDTFQYQNHPAYLTWHHRISNVFPAQDSILSYEIGDSLFTHIAIGDTILVKGYVIPFSVGNSWQLDIVGDTLIGDIDNDGIDDTLLVIIAEAMVTDSLQVSVPLGTFDAFKLRMTMFLRGWQSSIGDSCRIWINEDQYLTPYLGVIKDTVIIEDTIKLYNNWIWAMTAIIYSEAADTGYIGIAEGEPNRFESIQTVLGEIRINGTGDYTIDIFDAIGRCCLKKHLQVDKTFEFRPGLPSGVYFARVRKGDETKIVKVLILR